MHKTIVFWLAAAGEMAAPTTPPTRPQSMAFTPPRIRRQHYVVPGVRFVHAISSRLIWEVVQRVTIGTAVHEIAERTGVGICQVRLVTERGPVTFLEDFDEEDPVVSVVLLSK